MVENKKRMIRATRRCMSKADRFYASTGDEEFYRQYMACSMSLQTMFREHKKKGGDTNE